MDIAINKQIAYDELMSFLMTQFPKQDCFLLYEGVNDWDDVPNDKALFQYLEDEDLEQGFKYGLSTYIKSDQVIFLIERLSLELSAYFECATVCDASRVVLKENNTYYSLLFEKGTVYLVDDYACEETGNVAKIIELNYESPEYII